MVVRRGKHTKTKQRARRGHLKLEAPKLVKCPHCSVLGMPHQVCLNCGYYSGRKVIDVLAKLEKKDRKKKAKELASAEEETKQEKELNLQELSKK